MQWISVNEKLPEADQDVLYLDDLGKMYVGNIFYKERCIEIVRHDLPKKPNGRFIREEKIEKYLENYINARKSNDYCCYFDIEGTRVTHWMDLPKGPLG